MIDSLSGPSCLAQGGRGHPLKQTEKTENQKQKKYLHVSLSTDGVDLNTRVVPESRRLFV